MRSVSIYYEKLLFYDEDDVILRRPLLNQNGVKKMGQEYEVQNNHMNGQIVCVVWLPGYPEYNPVDLGLNVITHAIYLGSTEPHDPLCVHKDGDKISYLTGEDIRRCFRFVAKLINPNISEEGLKNISSHLVSVFACVTSQSRKGWAIH